VHLVFLDIQDLAASLVIVESLDILEFQVSLVSVVILVLADIPALAVSQEFLVTQVSLVSLDPAVFLDTQA